MNQIKITSLDTNQVTVNAFIFLVLIFSYGCVHVFGRSIPSVPPDEVYKYQHSFLHPKNNLHHPYISPNEKWFVYTHINPWNGERTLFYSGTKYQEKRPIPLIPLKDSQKTRLMHALNKWSPSGNLFAYEVETNQQDYIGIVRFTSNGAELIDFFEKATMHDYYWFGIDKLAYIGYEKGKGSSIFIRDYSNSEVKTIRTSFKTDNFKISKNGTFIFTRGVTSKVGRGHKELFIGNINHINSDRIKRIFKKKQIINYTISPNGKNALLYLPNPDYKSNDPLAVMSVLVNLEGSEIIHNFNNTLNHVEWSPDGSKLAYGKTGEWVSTSASGNSPGEEFSFDHHFYVFDIAKGKERKYGFGINEDDFSWSPKGDYILSTMRYAEGYPQKGNTVYKKGIYIFSLSDGKEIGCVTKVHASSSSISKKGNFILWDHGDYSDEEHKIFIVHNQIKELMYGTIN